MPQSKAFLRTAFTRATAFSLGLLAVGCGESTTSSHKSEIRREHYYGYAGRCLKSVTRLIDADGQHVTWQSGCSEVMEADNSDELEAKLVSWREEHCPTEVDYPDHLGSRENCKIHVGTYTRINSSLSELEEKRREGGECGAEEGERSFEGPVTSFGFLSCVSW